MSTPDVAFSAFVRRQTPTSGFSHTTLSEEEVLRRIRANWDKRQPGYRDGVVLVPVEPDGFYTPIVTLKEGDKLAGVYAPRKAGEEPRKRVFLDLREEEKASRKSPAVRVDIVLYHADVLAEDNGNTMVERDGIRQPIAEWEIISINASPTIEAVPMTVGTLLANHFHISGGTATNMTAEQLVEKLRESFLYWKDKAMVG